MSKQTPQRTGILLNRVDTATEQLLTKFSEIVNLSSNSGKDRSTVAGETYQVQANTSTLVRAVEDLLFVTRSLKEAWILGQIKPNPPQDEFPIETAQRKAEQLLDAILGDDNKNKNK